MRVLMIGAGGLGCAVATAAARAGWDVTVIDPDHVERSNLHRQVLFSDADVGAPKAVIAARALGAGAGAARAIVGRFDAENGVALASEHALVIEGTDRHESKFLAADACALAGTPIVHAGVVGWAGWAMAVRPRRSACLRCVFEEIPAGAAVATCAENGVVGAAVGVVGALQASLAVRVLDGDDEAAGMLLRYDVHAGAARASRVHRRRDCALCGDAPEIGTLDANRYAPVCPA